MNRYTFLVLLVVVPLHVMAQRLDGCPTPEVPTSVLYMPSHDALEAVLKQLGVSMTVASLNVELHSPRPDTRSLAALKLAETANGDTLATLMKAWLAEQDHCTEWIMHAAVTSVVRNLSYDRALHPGGQPWVNPFVPCKSPEDPLVTLRLEEVDNPSLSGPVIQVVARNRTRETIPFVGSRSPQALFSATVLRPSGENAEIPVQLEMMHRPPRGTDGVRMTHAPVFVPLPPGEDVSVWTWDIGNEFNMSRPGTYRVSLGGRLPYLGTTVCSNILEVKVGN